MARRSPGAGSIVIRRNANGVESYYGKWVSSGRQVNRRLGPKRVESTREGLTRTQAEALLRERMSDTTITPSAAVRMSVEDAGKRYLKAMEDRGRKPSSVRTAKIAIDAWLVPHLEGKALGSVTPDDLEDLMRTMRKGGLGPKTIRNYIGVLSAIYNYAKHARRKWAILNPVESVDLPPAPSYTDIRFLTVDEMRTLTGSATPGAYQPIDRALYLTAGMTGLRLGELIALRWQDVDPVAGRVRVRRTYDRKSESYTTPKSRRSERSVPLANELAGELERLGKWRYGEDFDPDEAADDLVFGDVNTLLPQHDDRVRERYRLALAAARLDPGRVFHDLRHSFAVAMAAKGVPIRTVQEWLGHKDIATTQRYADYSPNVHEREWVEDAFASDAGAPGTSEVLRHDQAA